MIIELWMIYSFLGAITIGSFSFTTKIVSEKNYNQNLSIFYLYIYSLIFSIIYYIIFGTPDFSLINLILASIVGILYPLALKTRYVSLKYLSSSTYFINYRIFSSTLLLFIGIYYFSEHVTTYQIIGVILGFLIFYLLLEKKYTNETETNLKKGLIYLSYGIILVSSINVVSKYIAITEIDIFSFLLMNMTIGIIISFLQNPKQITSQIKINHLKNDKQFILLIGIQAFFFTTSVFFINWAYFNGNLGIVYKIVSYSLFIPIILSIIIYKEKITPKKILAFILTIISIYLFSL